MAIRKIIELGQDEMLRGHARRVERFDDGLRELLTDMADTMAAGDGLGLAAPQVGAALRCVVIDAGEGGDSPDSRKRPPEAGDPVNRREGRCVIELVNPEIVSTEGAVTAIEGCLSVPGRAGRVVRPERVTVRAQDRFGRPFEMHGEGMLAVCLCHEIDHLDGILYVDRMIEDATEEMRRKGALS